jgi:hypothetical protein
VIGLRRNRIGLNRNPQSVAGAVTRVDVIVVPALTVTTHGDLAALYRLYALCAVS